MVINNIYIFTVKITLMVRDTITTSLRRTTLCHPDEHGRFYTSHWDHVNRFLDNMIIRSRDGGQLIIDVVSGVVPP
jgi:hypothetical protein